MRWLWLTLVVSVTLALSLALRQQNPTSPPEPIPTDILLTHETDGKTLLVAADGYIYERLTATTARRQQQIFDPALIARSYRVENGLRYRLGDAGEREPIRLPLSQNFATTLPPSPAAPEDTLRTLIGPRFGWTEVTLQTPQHPTVPDYVALRKRILTQSAPFADARIELNNGDLTFTAPPKTPAMVCSKASLSTGLIYATDGDSLTVQATLTLSDPVPLTLLDLESDVVEGSPGIRLYVTPERTLAVQLKALGNPLSQPPPAQRLTLPLGQPITLTWQVEFQPNATGRTRAWVGSDFAFDIQTQTLPFPTCIINSLEFGITAHISESQPAVVRWRSIAVTPKLVSPK